MRCSAQYVVFFLLMVTSLPVSADEKGDEGNGLSSVKTGRLSRYGVTAGTAIGLVFPLSKQIQGRGSGQLVYIEALPFLWGWKSDISRVYCIAKHSAGNAQDTADRVALQRSGLEAKDLELGETLDDNEIARILNVPAADDPEVSKFYGYSLDQKRQKIREFVDRQSGWKLNVPARGCWRTWLGAYVGRASSFNMNVDFTPKDMMGMYQQPERRTGELKPLVSLGVTFGPVSEVRLLLGATLSNVVLKADGPGTRVWTWTVALGGNLDIIGALLPK